MHEAGGDEGGVFLEDESSRFRQGGDAVVKGIGDTFAADGKKERFGGFVRLHRGTGGRP